MKKLFLVVAGSALLWSCQTNNNSDSTHTHDGETHHMEAAELPPMTIEEKLAKYDPVCDMEIEETWTDSLAYQEHMVHFCSTTCKEAFEAQPDKYLQ